MDVPDKPIYPKEVELAEENEKLSLKKSETKVQPTGRGDNVFGPRRLGRHAGDAVLVGGFGSVCLSFF